MANRHNRNYYPVQRNQYPYYGRYGYPQFGRLSSGIDMMGNNAFSQGWESMIGSLNDIEQMKFEDEQAKQDKFKELIDVSLEDIRYRWRDEGKAKYDKFMSGATRMAQESQGQLNWEQTKEIEGGKKDLEQFAGMSKEVSDWYNNAVQTGLQVKLKNPQAGDRTLENIRVIMEESGGLADTYAATQDPTWLDTGTGQAQNSYQYILGQIKGVRKVQGNTAVPDIEAMMGQAKGLYEGGDQGTLLYYDEWEGRNPKKEKEDFFKHIADQKAFTMGPEPSDDYQYYPSTSGETKDKRKKVYMDKNGSYNYRSLNEGAGIKLSSQSGESGRIYKNATIEKEMNTPDGERVVIISHDVDKEEIQKYKQERLDFYTKRAKRKAKDNKEKISDAEAKKRGAEDYEKYITYKIEDRIVESKSQIYKLRVSVPLAELDESILLHVNRMGMRKKGDNSGFDPNVNPN